MTVSKSLQNVCLTALLSGCLAACGNADTDAGLASSEPEQVQTQPAQETAPKAGAQASIPAKQHILKTGQTILSLAAIPATAHLGKSHIVAAHGADGVSIRNTDGTVLRTIDTPARLVAHYQNLLVVYSQDEDGTTTLKRYQLSATGEPTLVDTASPSPIAATTLQRTAIASLGPLQISGSSLIIGDKTITAPGPVTAVAAASYFPPLVAGKTLLIATDNGDIIIQANM